MTRTDGIQDRAQRVVGLARPHRRGSGPIIVALAAMMLVALAATPGTTLAAAHAGRPTVLHLQDGRQLGQTPTNGGGPRWGVPGAAAGRDPGG